MQIIRDNHLAGGLPRRQLPDLSASNNECKLKTSLANLHGAATQKCPGGPGANGEAV